MPKQLAFHSPVFAYLQQQLSAGGALWKLLLDYPIEKGTVTGYVPSSFSENNRSCFSADVASYASSEHAEALNRTNSYVRKFFEDEAKGLAVIRLLPHPHHKPENYPFPGNIFHHFPDENRRLLSQAEPYLLLNDPGAVINTIAQLNGSGGLAYLCLLTTSPMPPSRGSERELTFEDFRGIAQGAKLLLFSALYHRVLLVWSPSVTEAWESHPGEGEVQRVEEGSVSRVVLPAAASSAYIHSRLCSGIWHYWLESPDFRLGSGTHWTFVPADTPVIDTRKLMLRRASGTMLPDSEKWERARSAIWQFVRNYLDAGPKRFALLNSTSRQIIIGPNRGDSRTIAPLSLLEVKQGSDFDSAQCSRRLQGKQPASRAVVLCDGGDEQVNGFLGRYCTVSEIRSKIVPRTRHLLIDVFGGDGILCWSLEDPVK